MVPRMPLLLPSSASDHLLPQPQAGAPRGLTDEEAFGVPATGAWPGREVARAAIWPGRELTQPAPPRGLTDEEVFGRQPPTAGAEAWPDDPVVGAQPAPPTIPGR